VIKITGLIVSSLTQVPETGYVELCASDNALIPREVAAYLDPGQARQFYVGQELVLTLDGATSSTEVPAK